MKISTKAFLLAAMLAGGALASTQAADPVVITVNYQNGEFTAKNSEGTYGKTWVSTATNPGLTIDFGANNVSVKSEGNFEVYSGSSGTCTISMTTDEGWRVSAYAFTASTTTDGSFTITHQGTASTVTRSTSATISEAIEKGSTLSLVQTGDNKAVIYSDFTVTLEEYVEVIEDEPVLAVDETPEVEKVGDLVVTNIVDGHFNDFTTWYHLLDGKNFLTGTALTDAGSNGEPAYGDEYLFCVVKSGSGYTLYNKAGGTATPVNGAIVNASGVTASGKTLTARFAQKFTGIKLTEGKTSRSDGNATNKWRGLWTSNAEPVVTLGGSLNNMTTTDSGSTLVETGDFQLEVGSASSFTWSFGADGNNYISNYSFRAKKNGSFTEAASVTPVGGSEVAMTTSYKRIEGGVYDGETTMANFTQNGTNGKGIIVDDIYVTVRRMLSHVNEREGYVIYPREGVERRIPAIARVYGGNHAGRLVTIYDYRHNGGDIGGGNISLQIAVSDDNGATWSEPKYLEDAQGNAVTTFPAELDKNNGKWSEYQADPNKYWNVAFGDAALVADRESGKLLLMAVGGPTNFFSGRYDNPNQCVRWTSEDGGDTWTPATRVTYDILDLFNGEPEFGKIDSQFIGSGRIMQSRYVKVGDYFRIYCVLASQNNGGNTRNWMLYSDDFGQNWHVLGGTDQCPTSTGAGDECKAEELPDGTVILAGRNRYGNRNFNLFRYTNATRGEGKWVNHIVTDMGFGTINACDGEIMVLPAYSNEYQEDCYLILQSFPYGGGRNFVSIAYRSIQAGEDMFDTDMFKRWEGRFRIANGASVYSTMAWQANDKLAFFWEDKNCDGTYLDLSIEEITDGKYSYKADEGNKTALRLTEELLEIRADEIDFDTEARYVGQPLLNADIINKTVSDYKTKPSYNTYMKFNALTLAPTTIPVVENGGYRFTSAHDGHYANFTRDRYLAATATNLISTEDDNSANIFKVEATADGYFTLCNDLNKVYVDTLMNANNTSLTVSAGRDNAGSFRFISDLTGHTVISNIGAKNASYPAIHLAAGGNIVIWTNDAQASKWYMELVDEPDGYVAPTFEEPEYDEYDFDYETNQPVSETGAIVEVATLAEDGIYYDLQGRRVAKPSRGIYITNMGRKIRL